MLGKRSCSWGVVHESDERVGRDSRVILDGNRCRDHPSISGEARGGGLVGGHLVHNENCTHQEKVFIRRADRNKGNN